MKIIVTGVLSLLHHASIASSFTIVSSSSSSSSSSSLQLKLSDRGWDNGNFLDALGSGEQALEDANAKYQRESHARSLHKERQFQAMAHDVRFEEIFDDDGGGGVDASTNNNMQPVQQPIPQASPMMPVQAQAQAQAQAQTTNSAMMTPQDYYQALQAWQQAMVAFQQFSAANPQMAAQMTPPPPPPPPPVFNTDPAAMPMGIAPQSQQQQFQQPPPPVAPVTPASAAPVAPEESAASAPAGSPTYNSYDDSNDDLRHLLPKRSGGNRDAYEVTNSADVYFAQLKRDSTIRSEARKRGDLETANSPFAEKGVIALGNYLSEELVASRRERLKQNGGEFETSRDEMILPSHFNDDGDAGVDKSYTGVSYKDKLMQAKNRKRNSGN